MGQCQHQTSFFNHLCQGLSFIKGKCYRFIDYNMETIPQSQNSRFKMSMVWGYYGNEIHPDIRRQFLFLFDHFLKRRINTIRWQGQIFTRLGRNLWPRTECPAYQIYLPIQQGCRSMNCTNKRSLSPTDHAHPQFSVFHNHFNFNLYTEFIFITFFHSNMGMDLLQTNHRLQQSSAPLYAALVHSLRRAQFGQYHSDRQQNRSESDVPKSFCILDLPLFFPSMSPPVLPH